MSSFPIGAGIGSYITPNLTTTQLLMASAGSSPKDIPVSAAAGIPRVPGMPELPGAAHMQPYLPAHFAAMAGMADPRILYSALNGGYDMKESAEALAAWRQIAAQAQAAANHGMLHYDTHAAMAAAAFPYPNYGGVDLNQARRKNATRETTSTLKAWLYEHRKNPYPTKGEKIMLAIITKMTLTQVSTWFANARRRLKKENKMTWSPRNRTDDGSSVDGDDAKDTEADDVSIDLSDFEAEAKESSESGENVSPEKLSPAEESSPTSTSSPRDSKPRIWSLADIAASKPSQSVRHRPYPAPAFRPWFDATYRQFGGHPALMGNPLLVASRPSMMPAALRIPHMPPTPTSPESTREKSPITSTTEVTKSALLPPAKLAEKSAER